MSDMLTPQSCPHFASDTREFTDTCYEQLARVQAESAVAWDETHDRAVIVGYDAVSKAAKDPRRFSSERTLSRMVGEELIQLIPVESDPPAHKQWRDLLKPFFTQRAAANHAPAIRAAVDDLIDVFQDEGRCDGVADLAAPLPARVVFAQVLNLPEDDVEQCIAHTDVFVGEDLDARRQGITNLGLYAFQRVQTRRQEPPGDDLIWSIVSAVIDGKPVDDVQATCTLITMMLASLETTKSGVASMLMHFATHPEHQAAIAEDRSLIPAAAEECVRLYTPALGHGRVVKGDCEFAGVDFKDDELVALSFAAACRDPRKFENPDQLRFDRPSNRHLGYGVGIHYCLGVFYAREMLIATLERALERLPNWRVEPGREAEWSVAAVRTLKTLPLVFDRADDAGAYGRRAAEVVS